MISHFGNSFFRFLFILNSAALLPFVCNAHESGNMNSVRAISGTEVNPTASKYPPKLGVPTNSSAPDYDGRIVEYDLTVEEKILSPAGSPVRVLTINGEFPGPTLRFHEGDLARIRLHNHLSKEETSLHWHGLLLPNSQDGVPHLTTPPLAPGQTLTYEFLIKQNGTYWYHSHTGMQQQRGALGSIVVLPRRSEIAHSAAPHVDRDQVLLFSDWSNESPEEVLRTLKRGSNWYSIKKQAAQSLLGAAREGFLSEYLSREKARLPPMDVADVAYDAFLVNGVRRYHVEGKPGERVRLRLINASSATYYYVESATGPLTVVAADGPAVEPVEVRRLLMGIAETYDAIITIPATGTWEIRASAQDGSGWTSAEVGAGILHSAPTVQRPNLYDMDQLLMPGLEEGDLEHSREEMEGAGKSGKDSGVCRLCMERPLSPYRHLRALHSTAMPENAARRTIALHLTGDMQRYEWSLNGKTMTEESTIPVKRGEVLRLELINDTMMHHPMHLHGHFFRLLNGQGAFAPLKHTVDVPPMSRRIIEFEANEQGDWLFHCHVLYHMMEGMGRVLHYADSDGPDMKMHLGEHGMPMRYAFADFNALSNASSGQARLQSGRNSLLIPWELGWRRTEGRTEYEVDALGERVLGTNVGVVGGMRLSNMHPGANRPLAGGWYRLPYLVMGMATLDMKGATRLALSKDFQFTSRLNLQVRGQYDTRQHWQEVVRSDYTLTKTVSLSAAYHSDYGFGAGLGFHF